MANDLLTLHGHFTYHAPRPARRLMARLYLRCQSLTRRYAHA